MVLGAHSDPSSVFTLFVKKLLKEQAQTVSVNSPISVAVVLTPFRGASELMLIFGVHWIEWESKIQFCRKSSSQTYVA